MNAKIIKQSLFVSAMITCSILSGNAEAAQRLYSPYVTLGELEIEYFGSRSIDDDDSKDNKQKQQLAIGYGVNEWWKTEFYGKFAKAPQDNIKFDKWELENIFQLTERGEYWLDIGAAIAYEWTPQSNRADTLETRLLLAKDFDKTSHILNVIAEKNVGSGPKAGLEGKLLWSSRYNYSRYFEPGFEIESDFGELKKTGSFDNQKHYIGPAAYGKIPLNFTTHADGLKYRVGYLFGVSDATNDSEMIAQVEYEIHF
jgi:hypothetical protein